MNLRLPIVLTLFKAELRMVLRDRRILFTSILLPMLVMPLLYLGSNWTLKKREQKLRETTYRYAIGGEAKSEARKTVETTRSRLDSERQEKTNRTFKFVEVASQSPTQALAKGEVEIIMEHSAPTVASPSQTATNSDDGEPEISGVPETRIVYRGDRDFSSAAMNRMTDALRDTRRDERRDLLKQRGFPIPPAGAGVIKEVDVASKGHVAGLTIGRGITLLLLLFVLTGGSVVATDSLAGEKERGTLESLLTTSARRIEIIAAKHLVILAIALLITTIQTCNLLIYAGLKLLPVQVHLAAAITPGVALLLMVLFLPVLALVASILLLVSGYSRTYKEAQMMFFPVFLLGMLPALTPFLPGLSLRSAIVLAPVANIALAAREILIGAYDWPMILLAWVVTAAAAAWVTRRCAIALSTEKLITATDRDEVDYRGGVALFSRHVARWFAVMWAALLIVSNYLEKADIRLQLFVNLVVLFFGACCIMLKRYQLKPREALALRAPKFWVWPAVLVAVPGGLLTASGLFRLVNHFIPISTKMMEEFDNAVIPPDVSFLQLLFFLTVLPAVFEEITFRGLLLHGLSRRLRPPTLALVVGIVFGLFHVALFRLAPTMCLGVLLAAVTLLTGSIFPAMLWHGLSNAAGVLAYKMKIPIEQLDATCYLLGAGLLAASLWMIWRNRTPYPGLLAWREPAQSQD